MQPLIGLVHSRLLLLPRLGSTIDSEVLTGYDNHQDRLEQIRRQTKEVIPGAGADNAFKLHKLAETFVDSLDDFAPVKEIVVTGHSDFVFSGAGRNIGDEDRVSQRRAEDAWRELQIEIFKVPFGLFTPLAFFDALRTGRLTAVVGGVGARQPLVATSSPRNRRVVISLHSTQTIHI